MKAFVKTRGGGGGEGERCVAGYVDRRFLKRFLRIKRKSN